MTDDSLCGDCMDGKCHGGDPDECGCARHAASVEAAEQAREDEEHEPYHCDNDGGAGEAACGACLGGWCGFDDGHCYPGSCNDDEDDAGCEHCGCCACLSCEYSRVA